MKKKFILILTLIFLLAVPYSCAERYYTDYQGKVTKGYKRPPKKWQKPKSRYMEPKKKD